MSNLNNTKSESEANPDLQSNFKSPNTHSPPDQEERFLYSDLGTCIVKSNSKQFIDSELYLYKDRKQSDTESEGKLKIIQQIKQLQEELLEMNKRVIDSEEIIKEKETEAEELKELLVKLKYSQETILEVSEKESFCQSCRMF